MGAAKKDFKFQAVRCAAVRPRRTAATVRMTLKALALILSTAAALIKTTLPGALVYYNEAKN